MRSSMPRPYYVVLFNHNVNVRLKQMKKKPLQSYNDPMIKSSAFFNTIEKTTCQLSFSFGYFAIIINSIIFA